MSEPIYVITPEYQPSQASITVGGDPFYKASGGTENIAVKRAGLDVGTVALIGIPLGIFFVWMLLRKKS